MAWSLRLMLCVGFVLGLGLGQLDPGSAHAFEYKVRPGDTFRSLAARFYDTPRQWERIVNANNIKPGGTIRPGQTLLIPENGDASNPAARLSRVTGQVSSLAPAQEAWKPAKAMQPLLWQHGLRTSADSAVDLKLRDGSMLRLSEKAEMVMLGVVSAPGEPLRLRVRLHSGRVELEGSPENPVTLEVLVGNQLWTLQGGDVVLAREKRDVQVAVVQGLISHKQGQVLPGFGGRVRHDGTRQRLRRLPAPVALKPVPQGQPLDLVLALDAEVSLTWPKAQEAAQYEARLVEADRAGAVVWSYRGDAHEAVAKLDKSGLFDLQVRALNKAGLPGPWRSKSLYALRAQSTRKVQQVTAQGLRFLGTVSFLIDAPEEGTVLLRMDRENSEVLRGTTRVSLDKTGMHNLGVTALVSGPGHARREVKAQLAMEVMKIPDVKVSFAPHMLDPMARPPEVEVRVELRDSLGRPVVGSNPMVQAGTRRCIAEATQTPGLYICTVRPRAAPGLETLPLIVHGEGGSFMVTEHFEVSMPDPSQLRPRAVSVKLP